MLLANKTVAEKIGCVPKNKKAKVLPYRIHDLPDPEKLENLSQFIARFGYKVRTSGTKTDISNPSTIYWTTYTERKKRT